MLKITTDNIQYDEQNSTIAISMTNIKDDNMNSFRTSSSFCSLSAVIDLKQSFILVVDQRQVSSISAKIMTRTSFQTINHGGQRRRWERV